MSLVRKGATATTGLAPVEQLIGGTQFLSSPSSAAGGWPPAAEAKRAAANGKIPNPSLHRREAGGGV